MKRQKRTQNKTLKRDRYNFVIYLLNRPLVIIYVKVLKFVNHVPVYGVAILIFLKLAKLKRDHRWKVHFVEKIK